MQRTVVSRVGDFFILQKTRHDVSIAEPQTHMMCCFRKGLPQVLKFCGHQNEPPFPCVFDFLELNLSLLFLRRAAERPRSKGGASSDENLFLRIYTSGVTHFATHHVEYKSKLSLKWTSVDFISF